jgi:hypothetical protein
MLTFPMQKKDNIIVYQADLKADKITKDCVDGEFSKFKIFKNGSEIFHLGTYSQVGKLAGNSNEIRRNLRNADNDKDFKIIINSKEIAGEYDIYEFSNIDPNTIDEIWNYYVNFFQHIKVGNDVRKTTISQSDNVLRLSDLKKYLEDKIVLELLDDSTPKHIKIQILKESKYEYLHHIIEFYKNLKIYCNDDNIDNIEGIRRLQRHYSNLNLFFTSELNSLTNIAEDNEKAYETIKKLYKLSCNLK